MGYSVESTHTLGKGRPDIIVGKYGFNFWIEIKNPEAAPADRKLTPDEQDWHEKWQGHKFVGHTAEEIHDHIQRTVWGDSLKGREYIIHGGHELGFGNKMAIIGECLICKKVFPNQFQIFETGEEAMEFMEDHVKKEHGFRG